MHLFKELCIKDKVAFEKEGESIRKLGSPISLAKNLKKQGFTGIHFIDLDLKKGSLKNFDIYDSLTQIMFVQVDIGKNIKKKDLEKIYEMEARAVFYSGFDPKTVNAKFSMIVFDEKESKKDLEFFNDIIVEKIEYIKKLKGKRVFLKGNFSNVDIKKAQPFAVIK